MFICNVLCKLYAKYKQNVVQLIKICLNKGTWKCTLNEQCFVKYRCIFRSSLILFAKEENIECLQVYQTFNMTKIKPPTPAFTVWQYIDCIAVLSTLPLYMYLLDSPSVSIKYFSLDVKHYKQSNVFIKCSCLQTKNICRWTLRVTDNQMFLLGAVIKRLQTFLAEWHQLLRIDGRI